MLDNRISDTSLIGFGLFLGLMLVQQIWQIVDQSSVTRRTVAVETVMPTTIQSNRFDNADLPTPTVPESVQLTAVTEVPADSALKMPTLYPELVHMTELENLENYAALESLQYYLRDTDPVIRLAALESLGDMGRYPESLPLIVSTLDDTNAQIRIAALQAIAGSDDSKLVINIEPLVYDHDLDVRITAIDALASMEDESATLTLGSLLSDPNPRVRHRAVVALGEIGGDLAMKFIQQALYDPEDGIRENAGAILDESGNAKDN